TAENTNSTAKAQRTQRNTIMASAEKVRLFRKRASEAVGLYFPNPSSLSSAGTYIGMVRGLYQGFCFDPFPQRVTIASTCEQHSIYAEDCRLVSYPSPTNQLSGELHADSDLVEWLLQREYRYLIPNSKPNGIYKNPFLTIAAVIFVSEFAI